MNATEADFVTNVTELLPSNTQKSKLWSSALQSSPGITVRDVCIMLSYSAIVIVSIFGNLLVCSIVARNASMRSSTYVFITNLALSDLLMTILNIPFNVARLLLNDWPFGSFMCSFVPLMQMTFVYVSTFTMTCIAVDRYRVITSPLRKRMRSAHAIVTIICIWLLAVFLSLPHAIFNKVVPFFTYRPLIRCRAVYPENMSHWITLTTVVTQYVLPLSVAGVLHCIIMARVWSRSALGAVTEAQLVSQARAKRKTIKMLILVVIVFALCWLPLNVFHLLHEFNAIQFIFYKSSAPTTIFFICHWLAMSSVCYNPFIYCCLNEHFRSGAISCIHCVQNLGRKINCSLKLTRECRLSSCDKATVSTEYRFDSSLSSSNAQCCSKSLHINQNDLKLIRKYPCQHTDQLTMSNYTRETIRNSDINVMEMKVMVRCCSIPNLRGHKHQRSEDVKDRYERRSSLSKKCFTWDHQI